MDLGKSWTARDGTIIWPWPTLQGDACLSPGQVYRFDISLAPRQWGGNPHHQLRLELTAQTPADLCPPSGLPPFNGTDPCRLTAPQQATLPGWMYTILHGPDWPSALHLPQLPWKCFPAVPAGTMPTARDKSQRSFTSSAFALPLDRENDKKAKLDSMIGRRRRAGLQAHRCNDQQRQAVTAGATRTTQHRRKETSR